MSHSALSSQREHRDSSGFWASLSIIGAGDTVSVGCQHGHSGQLICVACARLQEYSPQLLCARWMSSRRGCRFKMSEILAILASLVRGPPNQLTGLHRLLRCRNDRSSHACIFSTCATLAAALRRAKTSQHGEQRTPQVSAVATSPYPAELMVQGDCPR